MANIDPADTEKQAVLQRLRTQAMAAMGNIPKLMAGCLTVQADNSHGKSCVSVSANIATLRLDLSRPASGNVKWVDIEALPKNLGVSMTEAEGSRVTVQLFGAVRVFHRPHPLPDTNKGALTSVRKWLEDNGVTP